MPDSTLKWQAFNQKKPYFIATVFSLVAGVMAIGFLFDKLADAKNDQINQVEPQVKEQERKAEQFKQAFNNLKKSQQEVNQMVGWIDDRYYWGDALAELRNILIRVEDVTRTKFRTDTGVWIEIFNTSNPQGDTLAATGPDGQPLPPGGQPAMTAAAMEPGPGRARPVPNEDGGAPAPMARPRPTAQPAANDVGTMSITFRAVGWKSLFPEANKETALDVLSEIRASPLFDPDPNATKFIGDIGEEESATTGTNPGTFIFRLQAKLKRPLKL
jgi:hypothetical protein